MYVIEIFLQKIWNIVETHGQWRVEVTAFSTAEKCKRFLQWYLALFIIFLGLILLRRSYY